MTKGTVWTVFTKYNLIGSLMLVSSLFYHDDILAGCLDVRGYPVSNLLETTPTSQFTVTRNGTVIDTKTELIWSQCPLGRSGLSCEIDGVDALTYSWSEALQSATSANSSNYLGHNDWKLPNYKELESLVERACSEPAINPIVFPNTAPGNCFWSSSPNVGEPDQAWSVFFSDGTVSSAFDREFPCLVRLVRDIHN